MKRREMKQWRTEEKSPRSSGTLLWWNVGRKSCSGGERCTVRKSKPTDMKTNAKTVIVHQWLRQAGTTHHYLTTRFHQVALGDVTKGSPFCQVTEIPPSDITLFAPSTQRGGFLSP